MPWEDKSGKKGNPWGNSSNDDRGRGNRGGKGGGGNHGGGQEPPDLDEMLRKAQENFRSVMPGNMKGGFIILLAIVVITVLWLSSGLYVVQPGEHAVIQRFGKWVDTKDAPGLGYHFPAPIETATIVNVIHCRRASYAAIWIICI